MLRTKRLDDDGVARLKAKKKRYTVPDPELRGHYIRITPTGMKSFWVARDPLGKQHWRSVGAPPMKIDDARTQATKLIRSIRGSSPTSFDSVASKWRKLHCESRKLRSLSEIDRHLRRMTEAWAGRDFANIGRGDIAELLDEIEVNNGQRQATYCLQVFSSLANWLRLPIGLCPQILDCRFSLRGNDLRIGTFSGFAECRVTCQRTFGAGKTNPRNKNSATQRLLSVSTRADKRR